MNAPATISAIRPERIALTTYEAFQVSEPTTVIQWDKEAPLQRTSAFGPVIAESVEEARAAALANWCFSHKQQLIIRETRAGGTFLHVYQIVRKPDTWVWRGHEQVREQRLDAKFLCVIDGGVVA